VALNEHYAWPPISKYVKMYDPFTNERIGVYLDKHSRMSLEITDYFVKQISHLSKGVVIVASVHCQLLQSPVTEYRNN